MAFQSLCDDMCLKRLCVPSTTTIDDIRDGSVKACICSYDVKIHAASCFKQEGQHV